MDANHDKGHYVPMQSQTGNFGPTDLHTVIANGGGCIPSSGCFSVKFWSLLIGRDANTIRRWIDKYDVPHIKPGDEIFVFAADFLAAFPKIKASSGSRKRKE